MKHQDLIAIDIHTHAEVSCWNPFDNYGEEYDRAADKFFGSDYPLITSERWMKDFEVAGFKPEVMPGILKDNAVRLLGLK
ncbi:MAG: hypothetical protein EXR25_06360 [Limnohabitans sp.]|nr:hypothetical protein [Limnohabitans sp.]